ncbi:hypothetical protein [Daejeonella sp.]|uniref:DUF7935 family protein n=1 Tax=Daejeonella sp. TaxID=2805397 RepID=UPI0025BC26EB|nr:hypothetical protein [Daejeonella sp.]
MNEVTFLAEIVKYTISGIMIFFAAWYFIKPMLVQNLNFQRVELRKASIQHTLPLRLQAYERSVLFIERINPSNLFIRLQSPGMTAIQLHQLVLAEIRAEYQHNISQQIYVSDVSWTVVKRIKDETIGIVSSALNSLPAEASAMDLSKSVLTHLANLESENPYDLALSLIKRDIQNLF